MEYVQHLSVENFILYLLIILVFAKAFGRLAEKIGQPSVLGELLAGVVLSAGCSGAYSFCGRHGRIRRISPAG